MKVPGVIVCVVLLAGCGGKQPKAAPVAIETAPKGVADDAALPVTAPMAARDRMIHDLEQQSRQARGRAEALLQVLDRDE